jgi:hypothetical protein
LVLPSHRKSGPGRVRSLNRVNQVPDSPSSLVRGIRSFGRRPDALGAPGLRGSSATRGTSECGSFSSNARRRSVSTRRSSLSPAR